MAGRSVICDADEAAPAEVADDGSNPPVVEQGEGFLRVLVLHCSD